MGDRLYDGKITRPEENVQSFHNAASLKISNTVLSYNIIRNYLTHKAKNGDHD